MTVTQLKSLIDLVADETTDYTDYTVNSPTMRFLKMTS
jgi:hypothetical protein